MLEAAFILFLATCCRYASAVKTRAWRLIAISQTDDLSPLGPDDLFPSAPDPLCPRLSAALLTLAW